MKKLINYLNKNGVDFRPVSYGSNYFYNAPALEFDGIIASFDYTSGNYHKASADLAKLEKYCSRYGYKTFNNGVNPDHLFVHIMKATEKAQLVLYYQYQEASKNEFWQVVHERRLAGLDTSEENEIAKKIMFRYGSEYNKARTQAQKVA